MGSSCSQHGHTPILKDLVQHKDSPNILDILHAVDNGKNDERLNVQMLNSKISVRAIRVSQDSRYIACIGSVKLTLWSMLTRTRRTFILKQDHCSQISFLQNSRNIAISKPGRATWLYCRVAKKVFRIIQIKSSRIIFSPSGTHMATLNLDLIEQLNIQNAIYLKSLALPLRQENETVLYMEYSPKFRFMISCMANKLILWNLITVKVEKETSEYSVAQQVTFSENGNQLYVLYGKGLFSLQNLSLVILDAFSFQKISAIQGQYEQICYQPDDRFMIAITHDKRNIMMRNFNSDLNLFLKALPDFIDISLSEKVFVLAYHSKILIMNISNIQY